MKINFKKSLILLLILLFLFSCYVFYFLYNKTKENNIIAKKVNIEIQKQINRSDELRLLNRGIKTIETERIEFEKHFIKSPNLVPFLDMIEELAHSVGATAEIVFVDISSDNFNLFVGFKAEGNFTSLYKFFILLENSPYELEFKSLNVFRKITQNTTNTSKWETNITIKLISFVN